MRRRKNTPSRSQRSQPPILSPTILKPCHHTPVFTAASMKSAAWSNANLKIVINGFAMAKAKTTTAVTFFGTWLRPIIKKFKCIPIHHWKNLLWSVTYAVPKICFCSDSFQQKHKLVLFYFAENHVCHMSILNMKHILTLLIGNLWLKINNCKLGLFQSLQL